MAQCYGWFNFKGSSRNGGADRIFYRKGACFLVEFKVGKNKQSPNQVNEEWVNMFLNQTPYYVIYTVEEFHKTLMDACRLSTGWARPGKGDLTGHDGEPGDKAGECFDECQRIMEGL